MKKSMERCWNDTDRGNWSAQRLAQVLSPCPPLRATAPAALFYVIHRMYLKLFHRRCQQPFTSKQLPSSGDTEALRRSWQSVRNKPHDSCVRDMAGAWLKFFYFTARLGAENLGFNKGKLLLKFITILNVGLCIIFVVQVWIICLLHMNRTIRFLLTVSLFFKT